MKSEVRQKAQESKEKLALKRLFCIVNKLAEQGQHKNRGHYCLSNAVQLCIFG